MTRPPASRLQLAGITVSTALGIVLGIIALTIAKINHAAYVWIWLPFAVCEAFAVVAGVLALIALRQRHNVIAHAEALAMTLEAEAVMSTSDFRWAESSLADPQEAEYSPEFSEKGEVGRTRRKARSNPGAQGPPEQSAQGPREDRRSGYLNEAQDVRDALVDSGDVEIAERLQAAILDLAPKTGRRTIR